MVSVQRHRYPVHFVRYNLLISHVLFNSKIFLATHTLQFAAFLLHRINIFQSLKWLLKLLPLLPAPNTPHKPTLQFSDLLLERRQ